jgi:4,5-dihydroxyphthalate decarboxylase
MNKMNAPKHSAQASDAASTPLTLRTLLGRYANTAALKDGAIRSSWLTLDFDPAAKPAHAFKRAVRDIEFDVAELSVVTYLIAKSMGRPLALLPAVMFSRMQHPYLVYDSHRGVMTPQDLVGKRIGVAYYTTATSTWLREILATDYGLDIERISWLAQEDPHVAGFVDPPNVRRIPQNSDLVAMLFAGEIDALILTPVPDHPRLTPVIQRPGTAAAEWYGKHGHLQLNHMIVVKSGLVDERPDAVKELWRMLVEAKRIGSTEHTTAQQVDSVPYGLQSVAPHLEAAIDCIYRQKLIPHRFAVDELFGEVTAGLRAG